MIQGSYLNDDEYTFIKSILDQRLPVYRTIQSAYGEICNRNSTFRRYNGWKNLRDAYFLKRDNDVQVNTNISKQENPQNLISLAT